MKAVLQAGWLMTNAVGNLIVVIITGVGTLEDMVSTTHPLYFNQ